MKGEGGSVSVGGMPQREGTPAPPGWGLGDEGEGDERIYYERESWEKVRPRVCLRWQWGLSLGAGRGSKWLEEGGLTKGEL